VSDLFTNIGEGWSLLLSSSSPLPWVRGQKEISRRRCWRQQLVESWWLARKRSARNRRNAKVLAVSAGGEEEGGIESKQEGWAHNLKSNPHLRGAAKRTRYADLQYYQRVREGEEGEERQRVRQDAEEVTVECCV
jgi:glycine/D-amino acid oxidase-like deaminating enzyme